MHTSSALFRLLLKRGALYDPIDPLILFSIKKFNKILDEANDFNDSNNSFRFNQHISIFLFIMSDDTDYQNTEFIEQQWNALQILINTIRIISFLSASSAFFASKIIHHNNGKNVVDIRFFNLHYDDKTAATTSFIKHTRKNIYFRDVHMFIEKVKNMIFIKRNEAVKTNLYNRLKSIVLK